MAKKWKLVRKIRSKYKHYMALHQERKMQKRSDKIKGVKQMLMDAPGMVQRDREYQLAVAQRWNTTMAAYAEARQEQQGDDATPLP